MAIPVLGGDVVDTLTSGIIRLSQEQAGQSIQKSRAKEYMQGQARVARGDSLEDIRAEQGTLDRIFGQATIQGAQAQTVVQAADKLSLHLQRNMDQFKSMTTEEFAATQSEYVTDSFFGDDPEVNDYITLAAAEVISKASGIHAKHHALYKQENARIQFENTLAGASELLNFTMKDPAASTQDKLKAIASTAERSEKLPGQTDEAYTQSLAHIIVNELKNDRAELYQAVVEGSLEVDGELIEIAAGIEFDVATNQIINSAYSAWQERNDHARHVERGMALSQLRNAAEDPGVPDAQLIQMIQESVQTHGNDLITDTAISGLLAGRDKMQNRHAQQIHRIQQLDNGSARSNPNRTEVAETVGAYSQMLHDQVLRDTEGMPEHIVHERLEAAAYATVGKAVEQQVVPPQWAANWNTSMGSLRDVQDDREISTAFVTAFQDLTHKMQLNTASEDLFLNALDSSSRANYMGVRHYMESGLGVEDAIHKQSMNALTMKETEDYLGSSAYRAEIDDFLQNPKLPSWKDWIPFFGNEAEIENRAETSNRMRHYITQEISRTGIVGEGTFDSAAQKFHANHETVHGRAVLTRGIPLSIQAGVRDPSKDFEEVLDYYMNTRGGKPAEPPRIQIRTGLDLLRNMGVLGRTIGALPGENKLGAGMDPEHADVRINGNMVIITPQDAEGVPLEGDFGMPRQVSLEAIGQIYNEEVIDAGILSRIRNREIPMVPKLAGFLAKVLLPVAGLLPGNGDAGISSPVEPVQPQIEQPQIEQALGREDAFILEPTLLSDEVTEELDVQKVTDAFVHTAELHLIQQPGQVGRVAVEAAVTEVEGVLGDTKGLLSRIAIAESRMGNDPRTFAGHSNGMWQVDTESFEETQFLVNKDTGRKFRTASMQRWHQEIQDAWGIDWTKVTSSDLSKPLYGAIAARLHLKRWEEEIPEDLPGQARYWKQYYNTEDGKGSPEEFLERVQGWR